MLNISPENNISKSFDPTEFKSMVKADLTSVKSTFQKWVVFFFLLILLTGFLPWTQNIQTNGNITTLLPEQRPQTIHSTIPGRIEKWYIREGDFVEKGDTIVFLSEIKPEYFDIRQLDRLEAQIKAKESSYGSYLDRVKALKDQKVGLENELIYKRALLENKIIQNRLKVTSDSIALVQAKVDFQIAENQLQRTQTLFDEGIKSLTDLEIKKLKWQETSAYLISAENSFSISKAGLENAELELQMLEYEYNQKIASVESSIFSSFSTAFETDAEVNKLKIDASNLEARNSFYFILAPQSGFITKVIRPGIGEIIKEAEPLLSIMPGEYELAVELYISPIDFPLVDIGQEVSFIFDGWPAFVFAGWPGTYFGTFKGKIAAIDNNISSNGKYRILVAEDQTFKPWPFALRPGSGAKGIALLNTVPVWYELWRQLNGFPPDFYKPEA
jgi:membrane fusion protein, adhesin transport system